MNRLYGVTLLASLLLMGANSLNPESPHTMPLAGISLVITVLWYFNNRPVRR